MSDIHKNLEPHEQHHTQGSMKDWMMGKIEDNYLGKFSKTFFLVTKVQAQVKSRKGKKEFGLLAVTKIPCSSRTYEGLFKWVWVIMTGPGLENMVQIETQSTPECQVGVPSQGWQQREEHRVVHHVQVKHYEGLF